MKSKSEIRKRVRAIEERYTKETGEPVAYGGGYYEDFIEWLFKQIIELEDKKR